MKDSGVEWIEKIPEDWEVVPSKGYFFNSSNRAEPDTEQLTASQKYGVISQKTYMELETQTPVQKVNLSDLKKVDKGDFVISLRSFEGGIEQAKEAGGITPAYTVLKKKSKKIDDSFFMYFFKSVMYIQALRSTVLDTIRDGKSIRFSNFSQVPIVLPPKEEQIKIAKKINRHIDNINSIISETQQSIDELKKYKQALITETVTKGLDKNAEMKDSGIEWIGKIPKTWDVKKVGNFYSQVKNKNLKLQESNLLSLSYGNIIRRNINATDGLLPDNFAGYNIVKPQDIVLRMTDLQNDQVSLRTGIVKETGIITSAYITIRKSESPSVDSRYIQLLLHSFDINKGFYGMGSGVRQGVTFNDIKKIPIVVPCYGEQQDIVTFLERKVSSIDEIIIEKQDLIAQLIAYKQSLIYEYVTGKIEA